MIITGLARLGRDAEVRYLANGTAVANIAMAFNYGKRDDNGNQPSQWIDAALFGERAEKLAPHLLKGKALCVVLSDPHIETYEGKNGTGSKLVARVESLEFAGSKSEGSKSDNSQSYMQSQQRPQSQPQRQTAPPKQQGGGYDFDSEDVPF